MHEPRIEEGRPERTARPRRFHAAMTMSEAVALHPEARWVISAYQFGGSGYCHVSSEESLAALAEGYAIPVERLLRELNALLQGRG